VLVLEERVKEKRNGHNLFEYVLSYYSMAAAESVNPALLAHLNTLLREKCPSLSLFYRSKRDANGQRRIGFYYNKTVGDVVHKNLEVSHIELEEEVPNELKIEFASTLNELDSAGNKINFKRRKLSLCLLYLAGMIAATEGVRLRAYAVSPIILYTMVKYFDCTIIKGTETAPGDISKCQEVGTCKKYMDQDEVAPGETDDFLGEAFSVAILTSALDYGAMLGKLEQAINDLNCVGLGGTRRKRKKKRTKRSIIV